MHEPRTGDGGGKRKAVDYLPKHEPLADTVGRIIAGVTERRGKEPEFKTDLEVLDRGIYGLHRSMVTVLAARSGNGKTSMACNIAFNLANRGKKVAFISLEMAREQIIAKMFCAENNVDSFKFLIGNITPEEMSRLKDFQKLVKELPLRIIDDYCFTQDELFTLVEHLEFRPEVLIFDHIQHIRSGGGRDSERENLADYMRFLKEIAMRHRIAVLVLSQINREGDEKPTIKNLKGSGAIEEMADHVLLLSLTKKDAVFEEVVTSGERIEAVVDIAKNRFGATGYFLMEFEGATGKFHNIYRQTTPELKFPPHKPVGLEKAAND